ncbi:TetR/AcrR family transcriptional regulator [Saccharopolyspora rosea]|uniref:TetR/AcrR family transcriptional regulator n=1 Tax=Saccharopolyspora rosea TaxID=524884 RepID=A0ABW3G1V2_9PSEU|nr:TetR/AcrR family transcriptional regulator [Saccharopolyspora rosea]
MSADGDRESGQEETRGPVPRVSRAEVRQRLLDTAEKLFAERGYTDSRLADIARAAGFTTGAVYSNFGSKHGLFTALLEQRRRSQDDIATAIAREPAPQRRGRRAAEILAARLVDDLRWHQLAMEFTSRAGRDPEAREAYVPFARDRQQRVARTLVEQAEALDLRLTVEPEVAAVVVISALSGLVLHHAADPDRVDRETLTQALTAVLAGLMHPKQEPRS